MFDFTDRIVVVTGAAGNLGRAAALAFQSAGASLVLVDRAVDRLQRLYPDLAEAQNHLLATSVDMTDPASVETMVQTALERFGRLDVLANTVGGYHGGTPTNETSLEDWDRMLNLNARTAFLASRAVVSPMLTQGQGKIVHVASRAAERGRARSMAYSVAKCAVVRLTESLSAEVKRKGINVNCVMPGTIDTPQNRESMPDAKRDRWVQPEAIADVILFLASDAARAIHGSAIPAYGLG
jgi:NAD(P)-dependent dehydrogenase (short-subunit alcohol dehydrogenase family)